MSHENVRIEQSEGAKQIQQFCYEAANNRGLALECVYWSFDITVPPEAERHILNVVGKTGTTEVAFSRADIEAYPSGHNTEKMNKKVSSAIEGIV